MSELLNLTKECLSIVATSTVKNNEIEMLINSAKKDLERVNIDVEKNLENDLIKTTIILYVKANFANTNISDKNEYLKRYKSNLREIQLSEEFLKKEEDSNV